MGEESGGKGLGCSVCTWCSRRTRHAGLPGECLHPDPAFMLRDLGVHARVTVQGKGLVVRCLGFQVQGSGFRAQGKGLRFEIEGVGCRV